jgi:hypothetical protein
MAQQVWVSTTSTGGNIYRSFDGISWDLTTGSDITNFGKGSRILYSNGLWNAIGQTTSGTRLIFYSTSGDDWQASTGDQFETGLCVGANGSVWIAGGVSTPTPSIIRSTDGMAWSTVTGDWTSVNSVTSVQFIGGMWFACGNHINGTSIKYSTDNGLNWSDGIDTPSSSANYIGYDPDTGLFIVVGADATHHIKQSADGITWSNVTTAITTNMSEVLYKNSNWVAVGTTSYSSSDGDTWTALSLQVGSLPSVRYGDGLWVIGGDTSGDGPIIYSDDETATWQSANVNTFVNASVVNFNGVRWVAGGDGGSGKSVLPPFYAYSDDGINWTDGSDVDITSRMNNVFGISIPCFTADTYIQTQNGNKKIQDIDSNDLIAAYNTNEHYKVKTIKKSSIQPQKGVFLVLIKQDSIDIDIPNKDTICTTEHAFLINDKQIKALDLINGKNITKLEVKEVTPIYHVLLENKEWRWMIANNLPSETMIPTWPKIFENEM